MKLRPLLLWSACVALLMFPGFAAAQQSGAGPSPKQAGPPPPAPLGGCAYLPNGVAISEFGFYGLSCGANGGLNVNILSGGGGGGGGSAADQSGNNATFVAPSALNQHSLSFGYFYNPATTRWEQITGANGAINTADQNLAPTIATPGGTHAKALGVEAPDGTVLAKDGTDATGVTPPTGATGIRGWLSGIYKAVTGTLATNDTNSAATSSPSGTAPTKAQGVQRADGTPVAGDGTDATGVTPPAGATGIRGWLSSIWQSITSTVANTGSTTTKAQSVQGPDGGVLARDGNDATGVTAPTGGVGIRGWLSGIYNKVAGILTTVSSGPDATGNPPTKPPLFMAGIDANGNVLPLTNTTNGLLVQVTGLAPTQFQGGVYTLGSSSYATTASGCGAVNAPTAQSAGTLGTCGMDAGNSAQFVEMQYATTVANAPTRYSANAVSGVQLGAAGYRLLLEAKVTNLSGAVLYAVFYDSATLLTATTTLTNANIKDCIPIASGATPVVEAPPGGMAFTLGATLLFSSTACNTATATYTPVSAGASSYGSYK